MLLVLAFVTAQVDLGHRVCYLTVGLDEMIYKSQVPGDRSRRLALHTRSFRTLFARLSVAEKELPINRSCKLSYFIWILNSEST